MENYTDKEMIDFSQWCLIQDICSRGDGQYVNNKGQIITVKDLFEQWKGEVKINEHETTRMVFIFSSKHQEIHQDIKIIETFMNLVGGKRVVELSTQGDRAYPRNILNYDIPRRDDDFGPLVIEMGIDSLKCILG